MLEFVITYVLEKFIKIIRIFTQMNAIYAHITFLFTNFKLTLSQVIPRFDIIIKLIGLYSITFLNFKSVVR